MMEPETKLKIKKCIAIIFVLTALGWGMVYGAYEVICLLLKTTQ